MIFMARAVMILMRLCAFMCFLNVHAGFCIQPSCTKSPNSVLSFRAQASVLRFDRSRRFETDSTFYRPSIYKVEEDPLVPIVETAVKIADQRKAKQIAAFRISHLTSITTFMMIIEVMSKSQSDAVIDGIETKLREQHNRIPDHKDGKSKSGWQVLDYDDIMIHVMSTEMMNHYQIDRKWRRAEFLDLSYLRTNNKRITDNGDIAPTVSTARSKEREDWSDSRLSWMTLSNSRTDNSDEDGGPYFNGIVEEDGNFDYNDSDTDTYEDDEYDDNGESEESDDDDADQKDAARRAVEKMGRYGFTDEGEEIAEDGQTLDPFWS